MTVEKIFLTAYFIGAGWLIAWEIAALASGHPEWTISDFTWRLEGPGWSFARFFIAATLIWLTFHLSAGWFK